MNTAHQLFYTVPEALAALRIGRTNLYKIAKRGEIDLRKVGGRTLVTAESLTRFAEQAPAA